MKQKKRLDSVSCQIIRNLGSLRRVNSIVFRKQNTGR